MGLGLVRAEGRPPRAGAGCLGFPASRVQFAGVQRTSARTSIVSGHHSLGRSAIVLRDFTRAASSKKARTRDLNIIDRNDVRRATRGCYRRRNSQPLFQAPFRNFADRHVCGRSTGAASARRGPLAHVGRPGRTRLGRRGAGKFSLVARPSTSLRKRCQRARADPCSTWVGVFLCGQRVAHFPLQRLRRIPRWRTCAMLNRLARRRTPPLAEYCEATQSGGQARLCHKLP